ncbi:Troponin C [Symbiodinium natans]|uniref:Troponin C protein n=1 Tax=Symbiodinium natans TaxID=878477 RepID=A0A812KX49_9DINO|nr:Troponin C [Symbiodinium natans]
MGRLPLEPHEIREKAAKALQRGCLPLPSHARRTDAERLIGLMEHARKWEVEEALLEKAEKMLEKWWDQIDRHEAIDKLQQAFYRMDRNADGFIDKEEWGRMMGRLEATGWTRSAMEDIFTRFDGDRDRRLGYEEIVSHLLTNDKEGHKLVKQVATTPPSEREGLLGLFGDDLLKGTAYREFPIATTDALGDADIIGVIFMTSSTIDKQLYPHTLLQWNRELLQRVASLYLDLRNPDVLNKPSQKFEVVLCSFDTQWECFTRTVGRPGPPAPWMVMPFDCPWERDYLWRCFNSKFETRTDPALVILTPKLEIISIDGFGDLDVSQSLRMKVFEEWCEEAESKGRWRLMFQA